MAFVGIAVFRGHKDTRTPLYATAASAACSLALNLLFLYGRWVGVLDQRMKPCPHQWARPSGPRTNLGGMYAASHSVTHCSCTAGGWAGCSVDQRINRLWGIWATQFINEVEEYTFQLAAAAIILSALSTLNIRTRSSASCPSTHHRPGLGSARVSPGHQPGLLGPMRRPVGNNAEARPGQSTGLDDAALVGVRGSYDARRGAFGCTQRPVVQ